MLTDESDEEKKFKQEHEDGTCYREPGICYIKSTVTSTPKAPHSLLFKPDFFPFDLVISHLPAKCAPA